MEPISFVAFTNS